MCGGEQPTSGSGEDDAGPELIGLSLMGKATRRTCPSADLAAPVLLLPPACLQGCRTLLRPKIPSRLRQVSAAVRDQQVVNLLGLVQLRPGAGGPRYSRTRGVAGAERGVSASAGAPGGHWPKGKASPTSITTWLTANNSL